MLVLRHCGFLSLLRYLFVMGLKVVCYGALSCYSIADALCDKRVCVDEVLFVLGSSRMATVPLLLNEDIELGSPPHYDEAVNGKRKNETHAPDKAAIRPGFFHGDFGEAAAGMGAVAFANLAIRLGFLRKVLGILSFQLAMTAIFCIALYVTPEVHLFLLKQ
ncbi:unnamed protein product [Gongylonema pulchrum]|uniref:Vesicle transport protein n=1 Tax=Gongylonema pulchrum TaxID=637853 RepID=A0A183E387_9BILA|nr:unnamed protein product [Gongylonema pulchrum]